MEDQEKNSSRRSFLKKSAALGIGAAVIPLLQLKADGLEAPKEELTSSNTSFSTSKKITLLYTSDIHAQLHTHDEFFWEDGKGIYKKRGGLAVLKTMINFYRSKDPKNTILIDGGDYYHGHAVASLTEGEAMIPVFNNINFDLMLPGNF